MKPKPDTWFAWTKKVPAGWQEDLDRLAIGEHVSRPVLAWEPSYQRWTIYELIPHTVMESIAFSQKVRGNEDAMGLATWNDQTGVQGPDPATFGTWVPNPDGGKRWRSSSLVSRTQWLLHRQYGGMPHLAWIIEGNTGGHTRHLGQFERAFMLASGADPAQVQAMADAWPEPGSLVYAEYDQRTFNALAERDKLMAWRRSLAFTDRAKNPQQASEILESERKARHNDMMHRVIRFIDNQVGGFVSDLPRTIRNQIPNSELDGDFDQDTAARKLMEE